MLEMEYPSDAISDYNLVDTFGSASAAFLIPLIIRNVYW